MSNEYLRKALQASLRLIDYNDENTVSEVDCCRRIQEAPNLEVLLRSPGIGHLLTFHALECPVCDALVRPYLDRTVTQLTPTHREDVVRLRNGLGTSLLPEAASTSAPDPVQDYFVTLVRELIEMGQRDLEATSCTFYVRDAYWKNEFRLLACPGVKLPETMHGFLNTEASREMVMGGEKACFYDDTVADPSRWNASFVVPRTIANKTKFLFGDFVEREGIVSSARLPWSRDGKLEAVLFINYAYRVNFDRKLKRRMYDVLDSVVSYLPQVSRELQFRDAPTVQQMISVLQSAQQLPAIHLNEQASRNGYFESILEAAMDAAGLSAETGLGTIHIYHEDVQVLSLAAYRGTVERIEQAQFQNVGQGKGVISWVALRRRPIIIHDLETSAFKEIHVSVKDGVKSELAVPMLASGKLLGVLNLESVKQDSFRNQHVRAIGYAACIAAGAARLYQEDENNRQLRNFVGGLLDCFRHATDPSVQVESNTPNLAAIVGQWLKAEGCQIWYYDPQQNPCFYDALATRRDFDPERKHPRRNGWSEYICRTNRIVWITNIQSSGAYECSFWDHQTRLWKKEIPSHANLPAQLNGSVFERGVVSDLGIPIFVKGQCVGVAWAEYVRLGLQPPPSDQMSMALGFAGGAGLIMRLIQVQKTEQYAVAGDIQRQFLEVTAELCTCGT